ncbi:MAG: MFS transporter [Lautropia sp.]
MACPERLATPAPVLMIGLAGLVGWRGALMVAAIVGLLMALMVLVRRGEFSVLPAPSPSPAPASSAARTVEPVFGFFNAALAACMLFFITINIASMGVQNMGVSLLEALGRMDSATAAGWITAYIGSVAVGMVVGGFVAASGSRHEWVAVAGTLSAATLFLLIAHPAVAPHATGALLCLAGVALGVVAPARDMLVRSAVPKSATGRAYGIV